MPLEPFTPTSKRNLIAGVLLIFGLIGVDQWVKQLAVDFLKGGVRYSYLSDFVVIEYAENRGAFLSLGATLSDEQRFWIFVIGVILILAFCIYSLARSLAFASYTVAYSLVISGGIGNLIDRMAQGYVVDYIHMGLSSLRTGVFNIADVAISAGLVFVIYLEYWGPKKDDA